MLITLKDAGKEELAECTVTEYVGNLTLEHRIHNSTFTLDQ